MYLWLISLRTAACVVQYTSVVVFILAAVVNALFLGGWFLSSAPLSQRVLEPSRAQHFQLAINAQMPSTIAIGSSELLSLLALAFKPQALVADVLHQGVRPKPWEHILASATAFFDVLVL